MLKKQTSKEILSEYRDLKKDLKKIEKFIHNKESQDTHNKETSNFISNKEQLKFIISRCELLKDFDYDDSDLLNKKLLSHFSMILVSLKALLYVNELNFIDLIKKAGEIVENQ